MTLVNSRPELMNLSFSGCGFLCIYHAGVAAAIQQHAPQMLQNKVLGASAGSIVACGLITKVCLSSATTTILKVVSQARSRTFGPLHPEFDLLGIVRNELRRILPANAHEMCTGRLIISLTRWQDHENVLIDEYASREELIDAIMCSCFIPFYCGVSPPTFRDVQYIDGGVSDNQPIYDANTVTVSPFAGESDICPPDWDSGSLLGVDFNGTSIRFTTRNMLRLMATLWPRSNEEMSKMCLQGFEDALRFLAKLGMSPCIRCLTIQTIDENGAARLTSESASEIEEGVKKPIKGMPKKKRSSINRFRGESECDTCGDSDLMIDDINVSTVFPSILKKTFEDATIQDNTVFGYFRSFRLVRYASTAFGLGKFPMDLSIALAKRIIDYLELMSPPRWAMLKVRGVADLMATEMVKQKSRYTNFSCLVAVTEVDKYGSSLAHSTMEHQEEREIELSEEAKRELRYLREKDKRKKMKKSELGEPSTSADGVAAQNSQASSSSGSGNYDVDSFDHVVDFTRSHEAMYEFHYMDANNKMRSVGLFADNHRHSPSNHRHSPSGTPAPSTPTPTTSNASRRLVHVPEEDEEAAASASKQPSFYGGMEVEEEDQDSGLSGLETKGEHEVVTTPTSKRDACCSPVREFSEEMAASEPSKNSFSPTTGSLRGRGSQRRHNNVSDVMMRKTASTPSGKKKTPSVAVSSSNTIISSDSEGVDGTEKLFVPSRKAWRASSEYENEKEPKNEASDTTA